jgi:hypothetical protein
MTTSTGLAEGAQGRPRVERLRDWLSEVCGCIRDGSKPTPEAKPDLMTIKGDGAPKSLARDPDGPPSSGLRPTTVFIWNNNHAIPGFGKHNVVGHVALEIGGPADAGTHVGWWPASDGPKKGSGVETNNALSIRDDVISEKYAPDHVITIGDLNTAAMMQEWDDIESDPLGKYHYYKKNCSTVADRVIRAGMLKDGYGAKLQSYRILTPLQVKRLAFSVGGKSITWEEYAKNKGLDDIAEFKKRSTDHGDPNVPARFKKGEDTGKNRRKLPEIQIISSSKLPPTHSDLAAPAVPGDTQAPSRPSRPGGFLLERRVSPAAKPKSSPETATADVVSRPPQRPPRHPGRLLAQQASSAVEPKEPSGSAGPELESRPPQRPPRHPGRLRAQQASSATKPEERPTATVSGLGDRTPPRPPRAPGRHQPADATSAAMRRPPPLSEVAVYRVVSFRSSQDDGRRTEDWERLADRDFSSLATAEAFARLRLRTGAITGAIVLGQMTGRARDNGKLEILSRHGRTPANFEDAPP